MARGCTFGFGRISLLHNDSLFLSKQNHACMHNKAYTQSLTLRKKTCEYAHIQEQEYTLKKA